MRYNEYRSAQINGQCRTGYSSDQATAALEEVFSRPCLANGFDYMGMSYQEQKAHGKGSGLGDLWIVALICLPDSGCVVRKLGPCHSACAQHAGRGVRRLAVLWLRRVVLSAFYPPYMVQIESDVYSQIGLVMLIGLAAKNATLSWSSPRRSTRREKPWLMLRSKDKAPFASVLMTPSRSFSAACRCG